MIPYCAVIPLEGTRFLGIPSIIQGQTRLDFPYSIFQINVYICVCICGRVYVYIL